MYIYIPPIRFVDVAWTKYLSVWFSTFIVFCRAIITSFFVINASIGWPSRIQL